MGKKRVRECDVSPSDSQQSKAAKSNKGNKSKGKNNGNKSNTANMTTPSTPAAPATPVNGGQSNQAACNTGISPTFMSTPAGSNMNFQTLQNGQGYILPPVFQYPQYMMNPSSPVQQTSTQYLTGVNNNDILSKIQSTLDGVCKKLEQLDTLQLSMQNITDRLVKMEDKISDIEESQKFIGDKYDTLSASTDSNSSKLESLKAEIKSLNSKLKEENASHHNDIIDLKCRSVRANLLFMGIPEGTNDPFPLAQPMVIQDKPEEPEVTPNSNVGPASQPHQDKGQRSFAAAASSSEDCTSKIHMFCENVLKIENARTRVRIDTSYRVGAFICGKTRPIVVRFADTDSKLLVKSTLKYANLRQTTYNVVEQFPQEVKDRRKLLIPKMIEARNRGDKAMLVRDKLYINNIQYHLNADTVQPE